MSRCTHEDATESRHLEDWLWCGDCRQLIKPREVKPGIGDGR